MEMISLVKWWQNKWQTQRLDLPVPAFWKAIRFVCTCFPLMTLQVYVWWCSMSTSVNGKVPCFSLHLSEPRKSPKLCGCWRIFAALLSGRSSETGAARPCLKTLMLRDKSKPFGLFSCRISIISQMMIFKGLQTVIEFRFSLILPASVLLTGSSEPMPLINLVRIHELWHVSPEVQDKHGISLTSSRRVPFTDGPSFRRWSSDTMVDDALPLPTDFWDVKAHSQQDPGLFPRVRPFKHQSRKSQRWLGQLSLIRFKLLDWIVGPKLLNCW